MAIAFDANLGTVTNSATLTTSAAAAADSRVVVLLWWFEAGGTCTGMTGGGLEWVVDKQGESAGAAGNHVAILSAYAPGGMESGTVLRPTFTSAVDFGPGIAAMSFTGVAAGVSGYVDTTSALRDDFEESWTTQNLVTTNANDVLVCISACDATTPTNAPGGSDTEVHDWNVQGTSFAATEYRIVSSTGTYNQAGTWSASVAWQINIAVAYMEGSPPSALETAIIRTLPAQGNGLELGAASGAWVAGSWVELVSASEFDSDLSIYGATWAYADYGIAGSDATREWIIELGTGSASSETVKLQIPWMFRMDTAVGHPLTKQFTHFLPEPFYVTAGTRVAVRANNQDVSVQTMEGFKIYYRLIPSAAATSLLLPNRNQGNWLRR